MTDIFIPGLGSEAVGIRERAEIAHQLATAEERHRLAQRSQDLYEEVVEFMRNVMGCDHDEIAKLNDTLEEGTHTKTEPELKWKIDGVRFTAHFTEVEVASIAAEGGTTREKIKDQALVVQAAGPNTSFKTITGLADLGSILS